MLGRNMLVALAVTALALGGCQKVWGFEDFEEGPAAGGSAGGGAGGSTAGSGGSGGGVAGSGGSGGSAGAAPCLDGTARGGMIGVRISDGSCIWVDETEVTRSDYEFFRKGSPVTPGGCEWNASYDTPQEKLGTATCLGPGEVGDAGADAGSPPNEAPVTCVDWCDAAAFCLYAGKQMCPGTFNQPTKGGWYDACSSNGANDYPYGKGYQSNYCNDGSASAKALAPVGSKTECKTPSGLTDMTGNASEWLDACSGTGETDSCDTRGGSFNDSASLAMCGGAVAVPKKRGLPGLGFRCCWLPK